ncbi:MAG: DUF4232 domain-containing protein [Actinomycetota bacterium]
MKSSAVLTAGALLLAAGTALAACGSSPAGPGSFTAPASTAPSAGAQTTGIAGDSSSPTASPVARTVTACTNSGLGVQPGAALAGMGHAGAAIVFTNISGHTCTLGGYPGVAGLDSTGQVVANAVRSAIGYLGGSYTQTTVRLAPGGKASALVEGTTNPTGAATSCPSYPRLRVTASDQTSTHTLSIEMPGCSPLQIHPVVAGTTGRA